MKPIFNRHRLSLRYIQIATTTALLLAGCEDSILNTTLLNQSDDTNESSDPPTTDSETVDTTPSSDSSEQTVTTIDGTVWVRCPLGQTYDEAADECSGEVAEVPCESVGTACPEGTVLPSTQDFENLLCGLVGGMDDVCPNDRFSACAACEQCSDLFGDDIGMYPVREHTVSMENLSYEYYVGDIVYFETGCATNDAYPDAVCNVRCIQSPETVCGDGVVIGAEACDDANTLSGDGCSETCELEDGYVCPSPGEPCEQV